MSPSTHIAFATQALSSAAVALTGLATAGINDSEELGPLATFARTAEIYHAALTKQRRLVGEHGRFAATHDDDDPAHQGHQERIGRANAALQAAERAFITALIGWREARGLGAAL